MKNKINLFFKNISLNKGKELALLFLVNIFVISLCLALFILFKNFNYIVLLIISFLISNSCLVYRYIHLFNKNRLKALKEIEVSFTYFYLDINSGIKPLVALNNVKSHSSVRLSENIVFLIDEIKKDVSIRPFIKFINKYNDKNVEDLIIAVYKLINSYTPMNIKAFNTIFNNYQNKIDLINDKYTKNQFSFITLTPLIGTAVITIIVIISVILLTRGYING